MKVDVFFVDLFANMLFVFMMLTVLAFSSFSEAPERALPAVNLTGAQSEESGSTGVGSLALSARKSGSEAVRYFVEDKEVSWAELPGFLRTLGPTTVVLRVDEELPTRVIVQLMVLLDNLKITNITFAYKVE